MNVLIVSDTEMFTHCIIYYYIIGRVESLENYLRKADLYQYDEEI